MAQFSTDSRNSKDQNKNQTHDVEHAYFNPKTASTHSPEPSKEMTLGWGIADWQLAYQQQHISLQDLSGWVGSLDALDPAWICLASATQIDAQIQALTAWVEDSQLQAHTVAFQQRFPLYGIPFAVKDNIDVSGFATTVACRHFKQLKTRDAEVVRRLKQAGAIVVAKTNLDQFATGLVGTRSPYGAVPNSFDARYISGGSSSGSASVVARGWLPFSLGTDTAGSGRVPAALNNIVGLKPTKGRFSNRGVFPACKTLDCVSIFALCVEDAASVADVLEGFDAEDAYSRQHPQSSALAFAGQPHFAVPAQLEFYGDAQAEHAFAASVQQLKQMGVRISSIDFTDFDQLAAQLYSGSWVAERTAAVGEQILEDATHINPVVQEIIRQGLNFSAVDAYQAEYLRAELSRKIELTLSGFDALLVPTIPTIYKISEIAEQPLTYNARLGRYTNFTNLADLCALALPAGFRADGMPVGISLIAAAWHDQALLAFAKQWQAQLQLPLGATGRSYADLAASLSHLSTCSDQSIASSPHHVRVAVVGAHLHDMPLNFQLITRQAVFVEQTHTAAAYRLYALAATQPAKPGLMRDAAEGHAIEVELWDVPLARFGEFVAEIPSPLGMGNVELENGRWVKGFICEAHALQQAQEISHLGGWRAYVNALKDVLSSKEIA